MLKRFVCMFLAASLLLSGCGGANDEEDTFSLSKSQQEKYAGIIEDELNSFYWHYDSSSLAYYEAKVPDDTDDNAQLFKASEESGFNMKSYAGKNAVCYTANLTHINSENAGLVYFYFVRNSIVGLFYSPAACPSKYVGLNIRNVFTPYAGIKKNESDKEYLSDNYSGKKLNVLSEGFSSQYKTENGSLFAEITSTSVNIYRYSRGNIKKYAVLSSSQLESLRPISVSFTPDGGVAVIVGTATEGNDEMETERIFSEKVLFFNNSFSKQNYSIDLSNGSYSCVSTAGDRLVLINDKTTEFYENDNGNYVKTASYYTNIQATDFKEADITRIAKYFMMKLPAFEAEFLQVDEDGDKVFKSMPCPFLGGDNLCSIYDVRPKACREFPHTDRKKIYQINHLTIKNTLTCPAAYLFVEKLKDRL